MKHFDKAVSSRKADSKVHRYVHGQLGDNVDAYFGPDGQFYLNIEIDGRKISVAFDDMQSARLAKRILKDTAARGLQLLAEGTEIQRLEARQYREEQAQREAVVAARKESQLNKEAL